MNAESNASPRKYAVALIGCISGVAVAATGPATNCNVGYLQGTVSSATHLSAASIVAATATTPEYCRVDGTIHTPTSQALTFAVGLPTSWNDKFVMLTQGGFAGAVPNPAGNSGVAASPPPLSKGYATASTDTGHRGGAFDASFLIGRPDLSIDFGHRGNKLTVDTAKALMKGYYQADPKRSLLVGCSNGGRSTMIHSQRYPNDFDGYVVGAPAWDWPGMLGLDFHHSNASFFSNAGAWMSPAKVKLLSDAVLAACDLKDGVKDGLIEEPRACTFNPASLICTSGDSDSCLTVTQVAAVKKYAADMKNSHGDVLSPPWLLNGDEAAGMTQ